MNLLLELSKHHNNWISIVKSYTNCDYAEDIVQEFYIHVHKSKHTDKIIENNQLNKRYIYVILMNMAFQYNRIKSKITKVDLSKIDNLIVFEDSTDSIKADLKLTKKIDSIVSTTDAFNQKLYHLHAIKGKSLRSIGRGADIDKMVLSKSMREVKQAIQEQLKEDYEDYKNNDFELI